MAENSAPKVGIFFVVTNKIYAFSEMCNDRPEQNGFVNGSLSHYDAWKTIRHLPEIGNKDYDYFPRGRVVFRLKDRKYLLYCDTCIDTDMVEKIVQEFALPKSDTILCHDEHYKCVKCSDYIPIFEND